MKVVVTATTAQLMMLEGRGRTTPHREMALSHRWKVMQWEWPTEVWQTREEATP